MTVLIVISLIIALIIGAVSFNYYDISFMLETAFCGAFIASCGINDLFGNISDAEDLFYISLGRSFDLSYILYGTIGLGIIGFYVQYKIFKINN